MHKSAICRQAYVIEEASQCIETLANLLERHTIGSECSHGPVLSPGEVGGIIQALKIAGRTSEDAVAQLLDGVTHDEEVSS